MCEFLVCNAKHTIKMATEPCIDQDGEKARRIMLFLEALFLRTKSRFTILSGVGHITPDPIFHYEAPCASSAS